jgi:hypothetical protein
VRAITCSATDSILLPVALSFPSHVPGDMPSPPLSLSSRDLDRSLPLDPREESEQTWFMVYGLRFIVYGLRFVVYGLWFTVCSLCFMVYGLRFIVEGDHDRSLHLCPSEESGY